MSKKLSVLIPTLNEEENIADCIHSVGDLADEIVVLDSFSSDRTIEIANSLGAKVNQRAFDNFTANKNFGLGLLKNIWVLLIDADERLTAGLRDEIRNVLQNPGHDGYWIRRDTFVAGKKARCWSNGAVLRLFRRDRGRYREDKLVHEELALQGTAGRLQNPMEHFTFRSFSQYLPKMQAFAKLSAQEAYQKGERFSYTKLFFLPRFRFLKTYLLRGGILDGTTGLIIAWLSAYSSYLKYAYLWQMHRKPEDNSGS